MPECYIGRGKLLARSYGSTGPFQHVCGESEITLKLEEEVVPINDYRYGRKERVGSAPKGIQASVECTIYDHSEFNLLNLLKAVKGVVPAGSDLHTFPNPIVTNGVYPLPHLRISNLVMRDNDSDIMVAGVDYELDADMGLVTFTGTSGWTLPYSAVYDYLAYAEMGLVANTVVDLELLLTGVNKKTGNGVQAKFYHAQIAVPEAMELVGASFSGMKLVAPLVADFSHHADDILSHYGKVVKL